MKVLTKKGFSLLLAVLLTLSLAACGRKAPTVTAPKAQPSSQPEPAASEEAQPAAAEPMSLEDYLTRVTEIGGFVAEYQGAIAELLQTLGEGKADAKQLEAAVEKLRATKEGFLRFEEIDNPPTECAETHASLRRNAGDLGRYIDETADMILQAIHGEKPDQSGLQEKGTAIADNLIRDLAAVKEAIRAAAAARPLSEEKYLAQVDEFYDYTGAYHDLLHEILQMPAGTQEEKEKFEAAAEELRAMKEDFFSFEAISAPPEKYAGLHPDAAQAAGEYGRAIDKAADELLVYSQEGECDWDSYQDAINKAEDHLEDAIYAIRDAADGIGAAEPMTMELYLKWVEKLDTFCDDFDAASAEVNDLFTKSDASMGDWEYALKELGYTRKGFLRFEKITNPPAECAEAHAGLRQCSGEIGRFIERYAGTLSKALHEEETEEADFQGELETLAEKLADAIEAVKAAANGNGSSSGSAAEEPASSPAETMSEQEYLDRVKELSDFNKAFNSTATKVWQSMAANPQDTESAKAGIERVRATKEGYLRVAEITDPPAKYAEAHKELSAAAEEFAQFIDAYADVMLTSLGGKQADGAALQAKATSAEQHMNSALKAVSAVEKAG